MAVLSKVFKPDNLEPHDFVKLSLTNIQGLYSNFVILKFSNSPNILVLYETTLDDSIYSCNFSVKGYLTLIWKGSVTNMHGLAVYMKEGLPFIWNLFAENSGFLYVPLTGITSFSVLLHLVFLMSFYLT